MYVIEEKDYSLLLGNVQENASEIENLIHEQLEGTAAGAWKYEGDRVFIQFNYGYCTAIKSLLGVKSVPWTAKPTCGRLKP